MGNQTKGAKTKGFPWGLAFAQSQKGQTYAR